MCSVMNIYWTTLHSQINGLNANLPFLVFFFLSVSISTTLCLTAATADVPKSWAKPLETTWSATNVETCSWLGWPWLQILQRRLLDMYWSSVKSILAEPPCWLSEHSFTKSARTALRSAMTRYSFNNDYKRFSFQRELDAVEDADKWSDTFYPATSTIRNVKKLVGREKMYVDIGAKCDINHYYTKSLETDDNLYLTGLWLGHLMVNWRTTGKTSHKDIQVMMSWLHP